MMARVRRHGGAFGYYLAVLIVAAGLAWVVVRVADLQQESNARQGAIDVLADDIRALRDQVESTGEEPVAPEPEERVEDLPDVEVPQDTRPRDGEDGRDGRTPTVAEVQAATLVVLEQNPDLIGQPLVAAVTAYLVANPPPAGPAGSDGADARPATPEEVLVAVSAVCANDACDGPPGRDGTDGADAPPVTDEQVLAQVARYCDAHGECRGQDGTDGRDGTDGDDGQPPTSWTFTALGVEYECTRTDPFDPAAPTYQCAPTTTEEP